MTATAINLDLAVTGGIYRRLPSEISANPYQGSLLSFAADGYVHELVAGEPFAGIARLRIPTADAASADGSRYIEATGGEFVITVTISGVGQDDAHHRRKVFASDDATFTFTAAGNTLVGEVIGVDGTRAIVLCRTADQLGGGIGCMGHEVLADAAATLTTKHVGKVLTITPSTGRTLVLPPCADWAGQFMTFVNLAAQVLTLDGDGSETINGAATFAALDAAYDTATLFSTGAASVIVSAKIA